MSIRTKAAENEAMAASMDADELAEEQISSARHTVANLAARARVGPEVAAEVMAMLGILPQQDNPLAKTLPPNRLPANPD